MKKINLFFVYPVTGVDPAFLLKMDLLADKLRNHYRIKFIEYQKPIIEEGDLEADTKAYQYIENTICESDLLVAICAYESTGLGAEIIIANQYKNNVLVCFDAAVAKKPRMVTGSRVSNPNLKIIEYPSYEDLFNQIIEGLPSKI